MPVSRAAKRHACVGTDAVEDVHQRSKRHMKNELSTDAHALLISGNTPQKQTVWQALYRSSTIAGMPLMIGERGRSNDGHCA